MDISLQYKYVNDILAKANISNCNPAPKPCSPALKTDTNTKQPLNTQELEHKACRRTADKIRWLACTRPDTCSAAKELARSLQALTQLDNQKVKHLLRYLKGTSIGHNPSCSMKTSGSRSTSTSTPTLTGAHAKQHARAQQALRYTTLAHAYTLHHAHKQ